MDGVRIFVLSAVITVLFLAYQYIPATNKYQTKLQLQQPTEAVKSKHQFITHGRWMPGRKHNLVCEFINKTKCCIKEQNHLHFEFKDKRLNKVDAVKEFSIKLRNKKILLLGDSLMQEFFVGLVALIQTKSTSKYQGTLTERAVTPSTYLLKELVTPANNSTVALLKIDTMRLESERHFSVKKNVTPIPVKLVRRQISNHDIIFINQGLHYGYVEVHGEMEDYFYRIGHMLHGKDSTRGINKVDCMRTFDCMRG